MWGTERSWNDLGFVSWLFQNLFFKLYPFAKLWVWRGAVGRAVLLLLAVNNSPACLLILPSAILPPQLWGLFWLLSGVSGASFQIQCWALNSSCPPVL